MLKTYQFKIHCRGDIHSSKLQLWFWQDSWQNKGEHPYVYKGNQIQRHELFQPTSIHLNWNRPTILLDPQWTIKSSHVIRHAMSNFRCWSYGMIVCRLQGPNWLQIPPLARRSWSTRNTRILCRRVTKPNLIALCPSSSICGSPTKRVHVLAPLAPSCFSTTTQKPQLCLQLYRNNNSNIYSRALLFLFMYLPLLYIYCYRALFYERINWLIDWLIDNRV